MATPDLIYCGGGNRAFCEAALSAGWLYGSRLPATVYAPLHMADQDWRKPDRAAYMAALERHRPTIATVLDWERQEQLAEVLSWAEDAAQFCEVVMIVPKVHGGVRQLPRTIGGKPVRLAYSVPTKFGGTELMVNEFFGWPIHLLGGNPHRQMEIARYLDVSSADGNMAMKTATRFCKYYDPRYPGSWRPLEGYQGDNAPAEALRRSLVNIAAEWRKCK